MSTTEIMELADLYYHNPYREGSHTHLVYADQKRAALLKAVEQLAVDAARYRFLRLNYDDNLVMYGDNSHCEMMMTEELDRAVDSAMQKDTP